jgi:rRNA maturation endonuclease Nob1
VEGLLEHPEDVRCAACHQVYEQGSVADGEPASSCPHCGDPAWLAVEVPVEKSAPIPAA